MKADIEARAVWQMDDKQLLEAIRGRGDDLHTLKAMEFMVRMFERAAQSRPQLMPGLICAAELTKLYSMNFATDHEQHPFRFFSKETTVGEIINRANVMAFDSGPRTMTAPIPRAPREPKPPREPHVYPTGRKSTHREPNPNSKVGRVHAVVLKMQGEFKVWDIAARMPDDLDIQINDIKNALSLMQKKGLVNRLGGGDWTTIIKYDAVPAPLPAEQAQEAA